MSNRNDVAAQQERLDAVLRKNAATVSMAAIPRTPLEELLRVDGHDDAEDHEIRMVERTETLRRFLEFVFQGGADPLRVLRHIFAVTKAVRPDLIGDMSLDDIAIICADGGKATVSARIERIYCATLRKAGAKDAKASFQKRSPKYAESQQGNTNRTKKQPATMRGKKRQCAE